MEKYATIIAGGGPAGLFCAARCSSERCPALVLEKGERPCKKLLLTGSGQCNFTHAGDMHGFLRHYGDHGAFLRPALLSFRNTDLIQYFRENGVRPVTGDDGKVFPASRDSRDILAVLLQACDAADARIRCCEPVIRVDRKDASFRVRTATACYLAENLVLCTGGASYPATGSTGDGYRLAASLGHTIVEPGPALAPVHIRNFPFSDLAGISFYGMSCSLWRSGRKIGSFHGDVLITHRGLSGPGILDNSRWMRSGDEIRLSFAGGTDQDGVARQIKGELERGGKRKAGSLLSPYGIPARLIDHLLELSGIARNATCAHLTTLQRKRLIAAMTGCTLSISSVGDFTVAMATRGGVSLQEVNPATMESRIVKNLYFAGEVLDIDGDTGGYNLQAAFSTGRLAAEQIHKRLLWAEGPRDTP